jgi:hypothetical protein
MANVIVSLIGSDLSAVTDITPAAPASSVIANPSANNTQATLRRCYGVVQDVATSSLVINTGLPLQAGLGSYTVSLTPSTPAAEGAEVYARGLVANYVPTTGLLEIKESAAGGIASYIVAVDLAHTVTR